MKYCFLLIIFFVLSCQKDESQTEVLDPLSIDPVFSLRLNFLEEFPIGHNLGLNFYNDITVGVLSSDSNNIKLITAANTSSYVLEGSSLENLSQATQVAAPVTGTFYSNYVGLGQLIKDNQGTIYSVFHSEQHDGSILPGNIPGFYASIGLGVSENNGQSFVLNSNPLVQNVYDINYDNGFGDGGLGEPSITYSKDSTEVYLYYVDHNRSGRGVNISMSKFVIDGNGKPDFSTCYYLNENNQFTTEVIRSKEVVVGLGFSDAIFPHVTYNAFIDKYIMVYSLNHYGEFSAGNESPMDSGIYYRVSSDGITWSETPTRLISGWSIPYSYNDHAYLWHPNLIYSNEDQSQGYLVYSKANSLQEGHKMWAISFELEEE